MQGVLVFLFALLAIAFAQSDDGQGCCFYRKSGFKDEIICTADPFNISDIVKGKKVEGVKSFFCTEGFSAAMLQNGRVEELVDCGDVVNETTSAIPSDLITVGGCLLRRCCFYTGKNKDGDEYCVNDAAATAEELARVQTSSTFVVGECVREWRASVVTKDNKKIEVGCGETLDFPDKSLKIQSVKLTACAASAHAMSEMETVENTFEDMNAEQTFADQAVSEEASMENFQEEFTDMAITDSFEGEVVDQAVAESNEETFVDSAAGDMEAAFAVDSFDTQDQAMVDVDTEAQAVADVDTMDNFDSTFAGDQFTDSFEGEVMDQAIAESTEQAFVEDDGLHSTFADDATFFDTFDQSAAVGDEALLHATLSENNEEFDAAVSENARPSDATSVFVSFAVLAATICVALF